MDLNIKLLGKTKQGTTLEYRATYEVLRLDTKSMVHK